MESFWDEDSDDEQLSELETIMDTCAAFEKNYYERREKRKQIDRNNMAETMNPHGTVYVI